MEWTVFYCHKLTPGACCKTVISIHSLYRDLGSHDLFLSAQGQGQEVPEAPRLSQDEQEVRECLQTGREEEQERSAEVRQC